MNRVGHPKKKKEKETQILTLEGIHVTLQSITLLLRHTHVHMVFHHNESIQKQFEYYHIL